MASTDEVKKLASLARLSIPEEKLAAFAKEFDGILAYVGTLDELTLPAHDKRPIPVVRNVFRADGEPHEKGKHTKKLVEQFPDREGNALKVKQIIVHD
ncbi:MAG: glutamyl-tRNA(Gln) and/or aspartyl-tRNA(Asn) amidotransferase subunit [Parcubacteria group bacterium]|nr:glutamyl-tRNA(Gln) and/or aspartyl-tRNA(Asn) amidotransferase subunit [Parcubacteria group bacterium]